MVKIVCYFSQQNSFYQWYGTVYWSVNFTHSVCPPRIAFAAVARGDIILSCRSPFSHFRKMSDVVWPLPHCIIAETWELATLTTYVQVIKYDEAEIFLSSPRDLLSSASS